LGLIGKSKRTLITRVGKERSGKKERNKVESYLSKTKKRPPTAQLAGFNPEGKLDEKITRGEFCQEKGKGERSRLIACGQWEGLSTDRQKPGERRGTRREGKIAKKIQEGENR